LKASLQKEGKANEFIDRRIGEAGASRGLGWDDEEGRKKQREDAMLKRIVQERLRRSKRAGKFSLEEGEDDDDVGFGGLTHKGKVIDESYTGKPQDETDIHLSDDEDDDLDKVDTMLHFGGGQFDKANKKEMGAYGAYGGNDGNDIGEVYRTRREELEDRIRRKKMEKAEKMKRKEDQVETFETMDESFAELAQLLKFRDKEQERNEKHQAKKEGNLSVEDKEMDAWDKEMKGYLFERKVKATDRTKTPEEIAKEEAERLHQLETKRLARMNGDFEDDDLSDISDVENADGKTKRKRRSSGKKDNHEKKKKRGGLSNPDELDSDDEQVGKKDEAKHEVRFTADGLVYVDKDGNVVGKVGDETKNDDQLSSSEEEDSDDNSGEDEDDRSENVDSEADHDLGGSDDEASAADSNEKESENEFEDKVAVEFTKGMKVQGNYRANEQYGGKEHWYNGDVTNVRKDSKGKKIYDITYEDGDFEEGVIEENVRPIPKSKEQKEKERNEITEASMAKKKKEKAKERASEAIPFVFEVPTTLDALHDMIATHATTGSDASLIIQRIHATNSVRLNHKNKEKMQNFYDVLLRRFVAVGDAIFTSGNGGPDLERYKQLNAITKTLYGMSQDSPECAGAVWSRRLGIFQKALAKRLRDVEVTPLGDACEGEFSAWPSTGTLLLLRALPHIFPPTDKRHSVVTPAIILLGQILAQTPVKTQYDVVMGLFCCGLMLEYTKDAKRLPPEALAFLAGVLRLYADDVDTALIDSPIPSLGVGCRGPRLLSLRKRLNDYSSEANSTVQLSIEKDDIQSNSNPLSTLIFTLHLINKSMEILGLSEEASENEAFAEITKSLLCFDGTNKDFPLPISVKRLLSDTARRASSSLTKRRRPLQRRKGATAKDLAIKTLAPRMEDPTRYSMSKDKGKTQLQAEHDRQRREYKREHKAAMRELRLDSAFIENERRNAKNKADSKAREIRNKNFAWLEQEQATMNQQVRLGGGLLKGGGVGVAKAKAKSGKLGIKKGGKF